jgi:hypothetical protein
VARGLTANFITEATAVLNRPALFFEAVFISATLRLWSGIGDISWNGQTWLGNGWLGFPSGAEETEEIQASGLQIFLSGVPQAILSLVLQEIKQGASGKLYLGFLNNSGAVISDPYLLFDGLADTGVINESVESANISINYESKLIDFERSREFRYTHESQRFWFPTDRGFEYVSSLQDWTGFWGQQPRKPEKKRKRRRR